ncbi:c-type cytochrome [Pseudomonas sp. LJDD11]|uniref:c-type cytochrome n=1 Tax=Pseudomonas sp. LJDD11 TaxID=2931984 RepID=UPI00211C2363|nr:c-type cytochrome [Pseudomonas sp. LJDD11]MCQ9423553.1 c-type cytochrome [Pseudomonas sp. LJDD11]
MASLTCHHEGERVNLTTIGLVLATVLSLAPIGLQAASNEEIAKRLEPVGKVCVQGQQCVGVNVTAAASGGAGKSADDVIAKHCTACHTIGLLDAPKIGDTAAWKKRADEQGGLDGLLAKAISGVNSMPAKGTCADCTDDELKAAIQKMSGL